MFFFFLAWIRFWPQFDAVYFEFDYDTASVHSCWIVMLFPTLNAIP